MSADEDTVPDSADLRAAGYSALAAFVDRHGDAVAAMLVASTPAERAPPPSELLTDDGA